MIPSRRQLPGGDRSSMSYIAPSSDDSCPNYKPSLRPGKNLGDEAWAMIERLGEGGASTDELATSTGSNSLPPNGRGAIGHDVPP